MGHRSAGKRKQTFVLKILQISILVC